MKKIFSLFLFFIVCVFSENPFEIDFFKIGNLDNNDYIQIEKKLKNINVNNILLKEYEKTSWSIIEYITFYNRLSRGRNWAFFSKEKGLQPTIVLEKIGRGGDCCIISVVSCSGLYPEMLNEQKKSLVRSGFNGYHLSYIGAIPNPKGLGSKYIGIPYVFKFLAFLEVKNMGFKYALWCDSSISFLRNPQILFNQIKKNNGFVLFNGWSKGEEQKYELDITQKSIYECLGVDCLSEKVKNTGYVAAGLQGWNTSSNLFEEFSDRFMIAIKDGRPFLSAAPEEVLTQAILSDDKFLRLVLSSKEFMQRYKLLIVDQEMPLTTAYKNKYFFYLKSHPAPPLLGYEESTDPNK